MELMEDQVMPQPSGERGSVKMELSGAFLQDGGESTREKGFQTTCLRKRKQKKKKPTCLREKKSTKTVHWSEPAVL